MDRVQRCVRLTGENHYGGHVPPEALAYVLLFLTSMYSKAIRMAFMGRSTLRGRRPEWLQAAGDVRFLEVTGRTETIARFEAPRLGQAARELYMQGELWPTRPPAEYTGFELLGGILGAVSAGNSDSDAYDDAVLRSIAESQVLKKGFQELRLEDLCSQPTVPPAYTLETVNCARRLRAATPHPRRVSVVGKLDMIRDSTQSFALELDDETEVNGVVTSGDMTSLAGLFRQRVAVHGIAVYRPSGRLLRLEADRIEEGKGAPSFWSKVPGPLDKRPMRRAAVRSEMHKSGVAAFFGSLPKDETSEEVFQALKELS